jgi:hypothetical protein
MMMKRAAKGAMTLAQHGPPPVPSNTPSVTR